ncbi:hypothetical protein [Mesorhizobium sp. ES1-3]|uniref:hypothetical protein n=1 Tax=Mesorhizobium sp. ES1-3 TaxID=2876628 RepID=UPI001CCD0685|nr:hypothetical protein [Mesorhizobium sp. ES1-3]
MADGTDIRSTAEANLLDGVQRGKERVSFPELGNDCCRDRQPVIAIGRRIDCSQGAFKESGWSVQTKSSDTAPMDGLILRAPNDAAIAVAKALKRWRQIRSVQANGDDKRLHFEEG